MQQEQNNESDAIKMTRVQALEFSIRALEGIIARDIYGDSLGREAEAASATLQKMLECEERKRWASQRKAGRPLTHAPLTPDTPKGGDADGSCEVRKDASRTS